MGDASENSQPELQGQLLELSQLVDPSEVLAISAPDYISNTQTWSTAKDKKPRLVLRPTHTESLSKIVSYLHKTELDFKVRSQGFGSASATDVLISLSAFNDFEFNKEEKYVVLGAGGNWRGYYDRMEAVAADWTIVPARTPSIGIGGSTLCSGFSWLSSQYGCVSDPANLLDAHVITADGRAFWAADVDPDLMWALRGTETGFAIVTHFKFRARPFPENGKLWAGPILIPRTKVAEVAKGIMSMAEKDKTGEMTDKVAMFLYVMRKELLAFIGATQDMLVVHAFDARGEDAGRKEFQWAIQMEGAVDQTRGDMMLGDVGRLQENIGDLRGTAESYWAPICLTGEHEISEEIIVRSFDWWTSILNDASSVSNYGYLLYELFSCRDNLTGRHSSAWPRPVGYKHMLLLGAGCSQGETKKVSDKAKRYLLDGPEKIFDKSMREVDAIPNALEDFHDVERLYGSHHERLRQVKTRVDPFNRLQGWIKPFAAQDGGIVQ